MQPVAPASAAYGLQLAAVDGSSAADSASDGGLYLLRCGGPADDAGDGAAALRSVERHHRIVVVGASTTALHALCRLVLGGGASSAASPSSSHHPPQLLPHITLVSAAAPVPNATTPRATAAREAALWEAVRPHLLACVRGVVTRIDRAARVVELRDGTRVPFDCLVLTPGLQDACAWRAGGLPSSGCEDVAPLPRGMFRVPPPPACGSRDAELACGARPLPRDEDGGDGCGAESGDALERALDSLVLGQ
jgi:hypothetical protein